MKSKIMLALLVMLCAPFACTGISLPYPFYTWHATAKTYAQKQEAIKTYSLTVKIKRHTKTIREHSFSSSHYKTVIDKAIRYAQKEQTKGLRALYKPNIRLAGTWDFYGLGNILSTTVPHNEHQKIVYWQQLEKQLTESFWVSKEVKSMLTPVKRLLSLGYIPLTLLFLLAVFLSGLVLLSFASTGSHKKRRSFPNNDL